MYPNYFLYASTYFIIQTTKYIIFRKGVVASGGLLSEEAGR